MLIHSSLPADTDYYSAENILKFADSLYEQGDYLRAASEYMRLLFFSEGIPDPGILYKIGMSFREAGEYERAIAILEKIAGDYPEFSFPGELYYEIAYCYFKLKLYHESLLSLTLFPYYDSDAAEKYMILEGFNYLSLRDWDMAALFLLHFTPTDRKFDTSLTIKFEEIMMKVKDNKKKSPVAAGILSFFFPGLGKLYAERFWDGVFSLSSITTFGIMAGFSFYDEGVESVKGWVYASIGAVFYLGNIYGSIVAANIYNDEQDQKIDNYIGEMSDVYFP